MATSQQRSVPLLHSIEEAPIHRASISGRKRLHLLMASAASRMAGEKLTCYCTKCGGRKQLSKRSLYRHHRNDITAAVAGSGGNRAAPVPVAAAPAVAPAAFDAEAAPAGNVDDDHRHGDGHIPPDAGSDDDEDGEHRQWSRPPAPTAEEKDAEVVRALVVSMLEQQAHHGMSQQCVVDVLLIVRTLFKSYLPVAMWRAIPRSWWRVRKFTESGDAGFQLIHCCPGKDCPVLFRHELQAASHCPIPTCGAARYKHGKPARTMFYFPLLPRLRQRLSNPAFARLLHYPEWRERHAGIIRDVQDGARWSAVVRRRHCYPISISSDAFSLDRHRLHSMTPVAARLLSLPPWMRTRLDAMMLLLLAPSKVSSVEPYLVPLLEELQVLQTIGVPMWDGHLQRWVRARSTVLFDNNDLVAAPKLSARVGCGTIEGACHMCDVRGIHNEALGCRTYHGPHRSLPLQHTLRSLFCLPFSLDPPLSALAPLREEELIG